MDWVGTCRVLISRPKVVHSLPGRLRVRVPFLQRLPAEYQELADRIAELLAEPVEIRSASASLMTGNALICYDPDRATDAQLMTYLRDLFEVFVKNRERFDGLEPEDATAVFEKLKPRLREAVKPGLCVNTKLDLEEDVLG